MTVFSLPSRPAQAAARAQLRAFDPDALARFARARAERALVAATRALTTQDLDYERALIEFRRKPSRALPSHSVRG